MIIAKKLNKFYRENPKLTLSQNIQNWHYFVTQSYFRYVEKFPTKRPIYFLEWIEENIELGVCQKELRTKINSLVS